MDSTPEANSVPPVERVRVEVDRWLDAVKSTGERAMEALGLSGSNRSSTPPVDLFESADEILVQVDIPGVSAQQVDLTIAGNVLTITASRERPAPTTDIRFHLRERIVGRFQRSIPLPATVNEETIRAHTHDGVLTVTLKKLLPAAGRSIPVSTGHGHTPPL